MKLKQAIEACRREMAIAAPDVNPAPLILGSLCLQFAQQRGLIALPQTPSQFWAAIDQLRDRGLPIPSSWLHPPLFSSVLLDRLAVLSDSIEHLAQVYELLQSRPQQRAHGVFYTPIEIADYIVEQAIAAPLDRAVPTILDLACGGGILLLRAYQRLLDRHPTQSFDDRAHLLTRCIYGVDIDPQAVAIAQIALLLKCAEVGDLPRSLPDLSQNIQCGNAVIHPQAAVLQTQYDAVIGNPPYLDAEQMARTCPDWRHYCPQHYRSARGNWDLFCVFIEQGLNLCRPGGVTSLIVPNKLISANYAAGARSLLAQENQLLSLRDYSQISIFSASVYPIVYIVQKQRPTHSAIVRYEVMSASGIRETRWLRSDRFLPSRPWLLTSARSPAHLRTLPTLGTIAQVCGAATVAEAYALKVFLTEAPAADSIRFVNSGTIDRYHIRWGEKPVRYLGQRFDRPIVRLPIEPLLHKRLLQARQPKLIVAGMTRQLECAIDLDGQFWPGKSTCVIRSSLDLRYLLGLINSRVVDRYFSSLFQGNRLQGGYLRVGSPQLRQLPMPCLQGREDLHRRDRLVAIVQQRLDLTAATGDRAVTLETQIEQLVCELYHLTDGEIAAIQAP